MKKYLVISDTHELSGERVLETLGDHIQGVDGIIHCGDVVGMGVIEALEERVPVIAVAGNMDTLDIKRKYPKQKILEVEGLRIGIVHGWGSPHGILSKILYAFRTEPLDAILFGHTHESMNREKDGILLLNPGSLLDRVFSNRNSLGILEVGSTLKAEIIEVNP